MNAAYWQTTRFQIDLTRPRVMGIVNLTPDSFSDGGTHADVVSALDHCEQLIREGADILDLGAESTRPGAQALSLDDELARLLPVLRQALHLGVPISVDTYKPEVMQRVLDLGADIVNDIWALRWRSSPGGISGQQVVAGHPRCGVCLMHMHRDPQTMQQQPMQGDVLPQVISFLQQSILDLQGLGVEKARIVADPGIGFGKTVAQNFSLLARQRELAALDCPLLLGWSRKSSLAGMGARAQQGELLPAQQRLAPSLAATLCALQQGAAVVRVHDVRETVQVVHVLEAIRSAQTPPSAL